MIALVPELKDKLLEFTNSALSGDALSERERALAVLGAAFIIGDIEVVKKAVVSAKQNGLCNEEIGQAHAIAIAMRAQQVANIDLFTASQNKGTLSSDSKCCN
ncbi:carboxymuconolactone decarboxylase family protein [Paenibacillus sp. FSL M7-0420]|uniref:carboxymuconolactone decarboxylase family protein n=1 Tax=Paenibacillus sp. FSL M7-0420 TaxID=2921609 RepID=UPI0030FB0DF3